MFGTAVGLVFTWLYNRSSESVLAVGLMHASANVTVTFLPETDIFNAMLLALAFLVTVLDRMWVRLPYDQNSRARAS